MIHVALTRGYFATIDDADAPLVMPHTWWELRGYASANIAGKNVRMHRLILAAPDGVLVDHKNRDTLDNRRENLRFATRSDQNVNRIMGTSRAGYRGVCDWSVFWTKPRDGYPRFQARLDKDGKRYRLPARHTAEEAALDYDALARELHGEFAILNFPEIVRHVPSLAASYSERAKKAA